MKEEVLLKLVVSAPRPFAGANYEKYKEIINKAMEEGHDPITGLGYFHGTLESKMGYDIFACLNAELILNKTKDGVIPGVYECEVIDYPGGKCKGFFWNDRVGYPRGLVVDPTDEVDLEFAQNRFNEKPDFI